MAVATGPVVEVVRQEGDRVLVSLPLVGFPRGFEVRPGTLVVLEQRDEGPAVYPLVHEMVVQEPRSESGEQLMAGGQAFAVQAATVRDEGGGAPYVVTVLERADDDQEQVVAVRSESQ
jgi:hypothetical protein